MGVDPFTLAFGNPRSRERPATPAAPTQRTPPPGHEVVEFDQAVLDALIEAGLFDPEWHRRRYRDLPAGTDVLYAGERRSLDAYAEQFKAPLDFGRLAANWAAVYGKAAVTALNYRPSAFPERNIVPHFMAAMGLTGPSGDGEAFHYNVSMPWFAVLAVLRLRGIHVSESTIAEVVSSFEIMFRNERPKLALFSPVKANAFDLKFAEANAAFAAEYAPDEPPITPRPAEGEDEYSEAHKGLWPEVELTLQAVAEHVRVVHETGEPPRGATP